MDRNPRIPTDSRDAPQVNPLDRMDRRKSLSWMAALSSPLAVPGPAAAQSFAKGPMTVIMPFTPGSPPDVYCRVFADRLGKRVGQHVMVDIRPGGSSTIGAALAAKAKPDGHTILYATNSALSTAPGLFKKLQYDPEKDFSAITVMYESYFGVVVRPEDSKLTVQGLADRIRKDPARNAMGGGSVTLEVANKLFQNAAKLEHSYARYNSPQIYTDLLGGSLNAIWSPLGAAIPMMRQGKGHILAVTSPQRLAVLPDTPTLNEIYPGLVVDSWSGFFVPAATPRAIVSQLYQHVAAIVKDDELIERGNQDGNRQLTLTPEQSDAFVKNDFPRWRTFLQSAGITPA